MTFSLHRMLQKLNWQAILKIIGTALLFEVALLVLPLLVSFIYREKELSKVYLIVIGLTALCGLLLSRIPQIKKNYFARDAILATGLVWIFLSLFGALPFWMSKEIPQYVDAFFETVSGFTTTGATILTDIESLSRTSIFWRSFTHWVGGMGVLVLMLAVLPHSGEQRFQLMQAEAPGPQISKLVPRLKTSAMILYLLYLALSVIEFCFLFFGGMPVFDSLVHTFGTAGTGGFSLYSQSIGHYNSLYFEMVITVFMFLFGVNFNIYFLLLLKDFKSIFKDGELKVYFWITVFCIITVGINILSIYGNFWEALRYSSFQVVSVMTTTGYATTDFNLWPQYSKMVLLTLMVVGAMAGSTGGGVKVIRVILLTRRLRLNIEKNVHPQKVEAVTLNGKAIENNVVSQSVLFIAAWFMLILICSMLVGLDNYDFESTISAVFTCIGNVGPGFGICGATGSFAPFSPFSKIVLSFAMLTGRLELYPILILFLPAISLVRSLRLKR